MSDPRSHPANVRKQLFDTACTRREAPTSVLQPLGREHPELQYRPAGRITAEACFPRLDLLDAGVGRRLRGGRRRKNDKHQRDNELRGHVDECCCGRCAAAAIVRADRVLMIVRVWQRQMATTRARAMR